MKDGHVSYNIEQRQSLSQESLTFQSESSPGFKAYLLPAVVQGAR